MSSPRTLRLKDLEKHQTETDCWIVVHSKIYDITEYLPSHPGGSDILLRYAGRDATTSFDEIHAPTMIEETLAPDKVMGFLDQSEVVNLPENQKADIYRVEARTHHTMEDDIYTKPDLCRIISAHDFETVAEKTLAPKAWAFYSSAANDLIAHNNNRDFWGRIMFRPRVMRDATNARISRSILGCPSSAPFFVAPAAMARLADKDGELAIARACDTEGLIQCISGNASYSLESIVEAGAKDQPFFFQLYVNAEREKSRQLLQKAWSLGVKAIFVTVDAPVAGKRELDEKVAADSNVQSGVSGAKAGNDRKGGGMGRLMGQYIDKALIWDDIPWIRDSSQLPVVIKGVMCAADAKLAMQYGCQGIVLSNHGGRNLDTAPPAVLTLLEIHATCPEVFDKLEVLVDGGVTRGGDILKALSLGARAVGIGRPFLYSLCYGQEGVEHLSQIFKDELCADMRLCGIEDLQEASPASVNTSAIDPFVPRSAGHSWIKWKPKARI